LLTSNRFGPCHLGLFLQLASELAELVT